MALVESENDMLARRTELVALHMVALQHCQGPVPWSVLAPSRKGTAIRDRDRLGQRLGRDRILRVLFGQFQESQGELLQTCQEALAFRLGPGLRQFIGQFLLLLAERLILLCRRGRLALALVVARHSCRGEQENQDFARDPRHGVFSGRDSSVTAALELCDSTRPQCRQAMSPDFRERGLVATSAPYQTNGISRYRTLFV